MENLYAKSVPGRARLTTSASVQLFIAVLSDLYRAKQELVKNLPLVGSRISSQDVKLLLLQSATVINGQIIRMGLVKAILGIEFSEKKPVLNGCVNLEPHLKDNQNNRSLENDAIILIHLIIAEGLEVDAFRMLKKLAATMKPKTIVRLMAQCHQESVETKNSLEAKLMSIT